MVNVMNVVRSFREQPGYTAMRGIARFPIARSVMTSIAGMGRDNRAYIAQLEARMRETVFAGVDRDKFLADLFANGLAFGLKLPAEMVADIRNYAEEHNTYADRKPEHGFKYQDRVAAEERLGKTILVAQYYNTVRESNAVRKLSNDPFLLWVAAKYLKTVPKFFGANLWWTFPTKATEEDRNKHAHLFHRDVDDFRFFKFFFYITDVPEGEGAHVCVAASNSNPPIINPGDKYNIRRYTDEEITSFYPAGDIKTICGEAGTGFAEDTLCIHKGSTPKTEARLLLQLQYGLFDYGTMNDNVDNSRLGVI